MARISQSIILYTRRRTTCNSHLLGRSMKQIEVAKNSKEIYVAGNVSVLVDAIEEVALKNA